MKIKEKLTKSNAKVFALPLAMALLPLLAVLLACALQGGSLLGVYLPASQWNDELFYFKQVEGMIANGFPYGFFGFNEGHADYLSFAAWSPILVIPYVIWGLLFGWSYLSPIIANIVFLSMALFVFSYLVKLNKKQGIQLAILFLLFTPFSRYMLSTMPEITCFSLLIIYAGLAWNYGKHQKKRDLIWMFVFVSILVLMRPYCLVFYVYPVAQAFMRKKWLGLVYSGLNIGVTGILYLVINSFLGAPYFTALFDTSFISTFLREGFVAGITFTLNKLSYVGADFFHKCYQGITEGLASGAFFVGFLTMMLLLSIHSVLLLRRKYYAKALYFGSFAVALFGMWIALLLMYKMTEGSKHLLSFIAVSIFVLVLMEWKYAIHTILAALVFGYLYVIMAVHPMEYQIPMKTDELEATMLVAEEAFESKMKLDTSMVPSFENSVIWVFSDQVEGEIILTDWQLLYELPEGFGIICNYSDYTIQNFDSLQSKYLCVVVGGEVERMCIEAGYELVVQALDSAVFELR